LCGKFFFPLCSVMVTLDPSFPPSIVCVSTGGSQTVGGGETNHDHDGMSVVIALWMTKRVESGNGGERERRDEKAR
jgi:hypothetical protein